MPANHFHYFLFLPKQQSINKAKVFFLLKLLKTEILIPDIIWEKAHLLQIYFLPKSKVLLKKQVLPFLDSFT